MAYPTLQIAPDSAIDLSTDGFNPDTGTRTVTNEAGVAYTDATATAYVTVVNAAGATVLASTKLTYISPGVWSYTTAATIFLTGAGPWTLTYQLFDQTGSGGVKLRTWYKTGIESA